MAILDDRLFGCSYLPVLAVRPAEMKALEELPEHDKDSMLPIILLRPWLGSSEFESTLEKIEECYGTRHCVVDVDPLYIDSSEVVERPAVAELNKLKQSEGGFANWCSLISENSNLIPCLQLGDPSHFLAQAKFLNSLGRGLVVRLPRGGFSTLNLILDALASISIEDILFVFDYGQASESDLVNVAVCVTLTEKVLGSLPNASVAISATTFPESFAGIVDAPIIERTFFHSVKKQLPTAKLLYSDRGSARATMPGGGGRIVPRIDYPLFDKWQFFRRDEADGYVKAAKALVKDKIWQPKMRIWGTQMIERTALNDPYAIVSPVRATSVRINLHMHRQLYFENPGFALENTDDDWVD